MTRTSFHMKFIAGVAALSIALTGLAAAPARAGDEDVAKIVGALVGLAILGAVINDNRKGDVVVTQPRKHPRAHPAPSCPAAPSLRRSRSASAAPSFCFAKSLLAHGAPAQRPACERIRARVFEQVLWSRQQPAAQMCPCGSCQEPCDL